MPYDRRRLCTTCVGRHTVAAPTHHASDLLVPRHTVVSCRLARTSQSEDGEAETLASSSGDVQQAMTRRVPADDVTAG